jgi:hypothetical protein
VIIAALRRPDKEAVVDVRICCCLGHLFSSLGEVAWWIEQRLERWWFGGGGGGFGGFGAVATSAWWRRRQG